MVLLAGAKTFRNKQSSDPDGVGVLGLLLSELYHYTGNIYQKRTSERTQIVDILRRIQ